LSQQVIFAEMLRFQHRHDDGSWADMVEAPEHGDPAHHDPERSWGLGRIFQCRTCKDEIRVISAQDEASQGPRSAQGPR
jgi:hypothetical protein